MNNYKKEDSSNRGGFKKNFSNNRFGGKPNFRPRNTQPTEMFSAICSQCGEQCEVPFRPSGNKPVLCNKCFGKKDTPRFNDRDRQPRREFGSFNSNKNPQSDEIKKELVLLNTKLEKIISLLQKSQETKLSPTPVAPTKPTVKKVKKVAKVAVKKMKKTVKKTR
ncbi:MAG: CxxC-x17-CxxC domain-containing protein [Candidatus Paceibacterota bacterium]|jgi:CxxC-x17-CxxC domain-containing protein